MSDDKHKKKPQALIHRSKWRSRRIWATYLGVMVVILGLSLRLMSSLEYGEIGAGLFVLGLMVGTWGGVSTALALRDQRLYRRRLGEGVVRVPIAHKHKPDQLRTADGAVLEVVEDDEQNSDVMQHTNQV